MLTRPCALHRECPLRYEEAIDAVLLQNFGVGHRLSHVVGSLDRIDHVIFVVVDSIPVPQREPYTLFSQVTEFREAWGNTSTT